MHGFDVGGGVEHFLHARASLGTFVNDHHHVSGLHLAAQDAVTGFFLGVEHLGGSLETGQGGIYAGGFDHAAPFGDIALEHGQSAVGGVGVGDVADAAGAPVAVQFLIHGGLGAHLDAESAGGGAGIDFRGFRRGALTGDAVLGQRFREAHAVHALYRGVQQAAALQFVQDAQHAAGAVHVLHMVDGRVGSHLAQAGDLPGQPVDVFHLEVGSGLGGNGQQVQHRVGGTAHGDVQRHGIQECRTAGDAAGEDALVPVPVIFIGILDNEAGGFPEQFRTAGMGGHDGAVARQGQADGFREAVHGIGGEHARAATAAGAGRRFYFGHLGVVLGRVGRLHHGIDQVQFIFPAYAGFHGAAGNEDGGDVQAHGGHEHAGGHLVAVADAHHGIGFVGVDHIFHAVGDDVPGRQGVEHAVMAHGNTVIHGDGVEFGREAAQLADFLFHQLANLVQMRVARYKLGKGVDNRDDRFAHLLGFHARCVPKGAGAGHAATFKCNGTSERMLHTFLQIKPSPLFGLGRALVVSIFLSFTTFPVRVLPERALPGSQ